MDHEAHVFFAVFEFGQDASVVTQLAGFEPTGKRPDVTHRHRRWTFKSSLPLNAPIEEHLAALVSDLERHASGIHAVAARFSAEIRVATYFRTFTPGFHLPSSLL